MREKLGMATKDLVGVDTLEALKVELRDLAKAARRRETILESLETAW